MAKMTECRCQYEPCGLTFLTRTAYVARGQGKYCSRACQARASNGSLARAVRRNALKPHIFYADGWWRVSLCRSRTNEALSLYHKAHAHAAKLNEERYNGQRKATPADDS